MIRLTPPDRPALEAFLAPRAERAMFPLGNLAAHGMEGDHPKTTAFWADDPATPGAVLGLTRQGMVLPVWDAFDAARAADVLRGREVFGCAGAAAPVRALLAAAGLADRPVTLSEDEPQFSLNLNAMRMPEGDGTLVPLSVDRARAVAWRVAYDDELRLGAPSEARAAEQIEEWIEADSHRFLMRDGVPVTMTGFNARLPDIVQIGGVYVPPEARNRGLGRLAVALHLAEARAAGARRATLFAANAAAARSYVALGFERIGSYALVLFDGAQVVE